jgi:hypothetical protein
MKMGVSYAFDEESYNRFYLLANEIGLDLKKKKNFQKLKQDSISP